MRSFIWFRNVLRLTYFPLVAHVYREGCLFFVPCFDPTAVVMVHSVVQWLSDLFCICSLNSKGRRHQHVDMREAFGPSKELADWLLLVDVRNTLKSHKRH